MEHRPVFVSLLMTAFLAAASAATASNTWYVNGVIGSDSNNCLSPTTACKTIGHAVSLASSGDSIRVAPATYTENLNLSSNLTILGSGTSTTIVDGGAVGTVFTISSLAHVSLSALTIQNGVNKEGSGGGIDNGGILTISNVNVSGNIADAVGHGIDSHGGRGGGILNGGTLTINTTTVSGNQALGNIASGGKGGGIYNAGTLTINRSTISGNTAALGQGGGIENYGTAAINNSTISANTGGSYGNGILNAGVGVVTISSVTIVGNKPGGLAGSITLQNTILAANSNGNCGIILASNGYNLSDDGTCHLNGPGDMNNTDPLLGPLQNNGGPTQTMALLLGSPAIAAGNPNGCTNNKGHLLTTDQRGEPRPEKGCDIGAYQLQGD